MRQRDVLRAADLPPPVVYRESRPEKNANLARWGMEEIGMVGRFPYLFFKLFTWYGIDYEVMKIVQPGMAKDGKGRMGFVKDSGLDISEVCDIWLLLRGRSSTTNATGKQ